MELIEANIFAHSISNLVICGSSFIKNPQSVYKVGVRSVSGLEGWKEADSTGQNGLNVGIWSTCTFN